MGTRWPETCWATYKGEINIILKVTSSWSLYPHWYIFLSYLAQFFLEFSMFQTEGVEKLGAHILCSVIPPPENRARYEIMLRNVERGRPQMTIWRLRIACCVPKTTDAHNMHFVLLFHYNNGCTNAPHCYVTSTLPVLFWLAAVLQIRVWKWAA